MVKRLRASSLAAFAAASLLLSLLAACGGGSEDGRGVAVSCDAIEDLSSFRYDIAVKLQLPGLQSASGATPAPAFGAFANTLAALLSDFKIEGAYVAPDRRQAILEFQGDEVELREIGDKRWERLGDAWGELDTASPDIQDLTPRVVCEELVRKLAPSLDGGTSREETVNGVAAQRYNLTKADLTQVGNLLGLAAGADLPDEFEVTAWFADDGGWPLKLEVHSQTTDQQGQPGSVQLSMQLRDVNDGGISIEPPFSAGGG
jgi:hypothetical protein